MPIVIEAEKPITNLRIYEFNPFLKMEPMLHDLSLFAVQRLASGQWLVRAPADDPLLPAVVVVGEIGSDISREWVADHAAFRSQSSLRTTMFARCGG